MAFRRPSNLNRDYRGPNESNIEFKDNSLTYGQTVTPSWTTGYACVRVLPGVRPEDNFFPDSCYIDGTPDLASWIEAMPFVQNLRKNDSATGQTTLYSFIPSASLYDDDATTSPYGLALHAIQTAKKTMPGSMPSSWYALRDKDNKKGEDMPGIKKCYVMSVQVWYLKDKEWRVDEINQYPYILRVSGALGDAIIQALKRNRLTARNPEEVVDLVSLDKGAFLTIWNAKLPDPRVTRQFNLLEDTTPGATFGKYNFSIDSMYPCGGTFAGRAPTLSDEFIQAYKAYAAPWERLLQCKPYSEQMRLLVDVLPHDLLEYAFSRHTEYMDLYREALGSKSAAQQQPTVQQQPMAQQQPMVQQQYPMQQPVQQPPAIPQPAPQEAYRSMAQTRTFNGPGSLPPIDLGSAPRVRTDDNEIPF